MEPEANAEMTKIVPPGLQVAVPLAIAGNLTNFGTDQLDILTDLFLIFFFNMQITLRKPKLKMITIGVVHNLS